MVCSCQITLSVQRWNEGATQPWGAAERIHPESFFRTRTNASNKAQVTLIRTSARQVRLCNVCRQSFAEAFKMPKLWWSEYSRNSNGYFGCETATDDDGKVESVSAWSRFLVKQLYTVNKQDKEEIDNVWHEINMFTHWIASENETVILLFDAPGPDVMPLFDAPGSPVSRKGSDDKERAHNLSLLYKPESDCLADPFWIHARTLEQVVALQDEAVWTLRDYVRSLEKSRNLEGKPNPEYEKLHDILRHAIHISETLDVAVKSAGSMLLHHQEHMEDHVDQAARKHQHKKVRQRLLGFEHMLDSLRCRSASNKERLVNEIQLTFNSVAQYDSGVSLQVGLATQVDSGAMKTIAFLTMAFLPATFICAIFSMSFFNYDGSSGEWHISDQFWIYWAFAAPVTVVTCTFWYFWQKNLPTLDLSRDVGTTTTTTKL